MICTKTIIEETGHGYLNGLVLGQNYDIEEEMSVEMEFGKRTKRKEVVEMVKVNGRWYQKNRFE